MSVKNIELEITVDGEGNVSYEVKGVKGKGCVEETKFLDDALGVVEERNFTRSFYQQEVRTSRTIRSKR